LQTTALVNEAYLRLADQTNPHWQNRAHFFAVAARAMRQIVVDYARSQQARKRGGGALKIELDEAAIVSPEQSKEIVDLHEALERLAALDSRKAQVVELKYFGGLNYDEMAEVLKISRVTVRRDWEFARAWLHTELHNVD
jgi:RNA polymerase sigma factor (TIGR02999 family)